ncbi:MAG: FeoA family protein [Aggregatilineales bacterium]
MQGFEMVRDTAALRTLDQLALGESAVVVELATTGLNRHRLMDLGILPGTRITAAMRSPLGDPTAYDVRGALVALRRAQAREIVIEPAEPPTPGESR